MGIFWKFYKYSFLARIHFLRVKYETTSRKMYGTSDNNSYEFENDWNITK